MSFFRAAGEDTSYTEDTQSDHPDQSADELQAPSEAFQKVQTISSEEASSDEQAVGRPDFPQDQIDRRKDLLLHALLEQNATEQALKTLNAQRSTPDGELYSAEDPIVRELAQAKYAYMVEQLSGIGVVSTGFEDETNRSVRAAARRGLENLASNVEHITGAETTRRGSAAIEDSGQELPLVLSRLKLQPKAFQAGNGHGVWMAQPSLVPLALQPLIASHQVLKLSRYERDFIQMGLLGKGGYGKVFRVQHRLDSMEYAVKQIVLSPTRIQRIHETGQTELDKVLSEIRTVARLEHPNVVRYFSGWLDYVPLEIPTRQPDNARNEKTKLIAASAFHSPTPGDSTSSDTGPIPWAAKEGNDSGNILFEDSNEESRQSQSKDHVVRNGMSSLGIPTDLQRTRSNTSVSSTPSKKSIVQSIGEVGTDIETIPRNSTAFASNSLVDSYVSSSPSQDATAGSQEPRLTLHIQMALHPLTLTEFLSSELTPRSGTGRIACELRHCFHVQTSIKILLCIMDGVEYLHSMGVVHRDLKPSNIFLSVHDGIYRPNGCVDLLQCTKCVFADSMRRCSLGLRIGDFGLVTAIARPDHESSSMSLKAVGTELYRPNSMTSIATEKLDVYALGVILFELLWKFNTKMERIDTLKALKYGQLPASFSENVGDTTGGLTSCLTGMLEQNSEERLSCHEARIPLQQALDSIVHT